MADMRTIIETDMSTSKVRVVCEKIDLSDAIKITNYLNSTLSKESSLLYSVTGR